LLHENVISAIYFVLQEVAEANHITSLPTILFFVNEKKVELLSTICLLFYIDLSAWGKISRTNIWNLYQLLEIFADSFNSPLIKLQIEGHYTMKNFNLIVSEVLYAYFLPPFTHIQNISD